VDPQGQTFQVPQLKAVLESEAFLQQSNELKKEMVKVAHTNQHHLKNHSRVSANCTKTMV
jgi:nicotinamide mononucleotide (NMN) deamidase PncC